MQKKTESTQNKEKGNEATQSGKKTIVTKMCCYYTMNSKGGELNLN